MTLEIETQNIPQVLSQEFEIGADNIESAIRLAIPSIHHVQTVLGNVEDLDPNLFYQNVVYDLASLTDVKKAAEVARLAINGLHRAQMSLQLEFIYNPSYRSVNSESDPEVSVSLRENIIARTVWRSFNPEDNKKGDYLAIQLTKLVKANMHFLNFDDLAEIKAAPLSLPFDEDTKNEEFNQLNYLIYNSAGGSYASPSAETCYIIAENNTELLSLAYQTSPAVLFLYLKGITVEELARQEHKSEELITKELQTAAEKVSQIGVQDYNWTEGFASGVILTFRETKRHETEYSVPTDSDWTNLFANSHANLPQIMSVIEHLPKLYQMCILFHWHYFDSNLTVNEWLTRKKISIKHYQTVLHKTYAIFETWLPTTGYPQQSIKEIVDNCRNHEVIKSTNGWTLKESSLPLRIMNLSKNHFPPGTFTGNEQRIITFIVDHYAEHHRIPNSLQISQAINLPTQTVVDRMKWMLDTIPGKDRFADENSPIERGSARYNLILWYKNNPNDGSNHSVLSLLNTRQRQILNLAVTLEHGYYLTHIQLSDGLKKADISDKRIDLVYKTILKKLTKA